MKLVKLIKYIPLLLTIIIIILLNINNQKDPSKLKILIWRTPLLSLGSYLAISNATGFILSYIITTKLAKAYQLNLKREIKYKFNQDKQVKNEYQETNRQISYDNILIDRDIKDPSPTMDANFRVIGKIERYKSDIANNKNLEYDDSNYSIDNEEENYQQRFKIDKKNQNNIISTDWNDDSYVDW